MLGTKIGRLVAAEFADPHRLATLGVTRFVTVRRESWAAGAQIVAVEGDRVVGHLFIQRESHPVTHHVATLGIAVAADRRGQGVGTALMAEAVRWARGAGVEKLVLSVYPHNTGAIALYRKFGFVEEEGRLSRQSHKSYGYDVVDGRMARPPGPLGAVPGSRRPARTHRRGGPTAGT